MTLPRSVADVLADHVTLEVECIDRMYLNVYVPKLQFTDGVVCFLRRHRGNRFASSALMEPISRAFVAGIHSFATNQGWSSWTSPRDSARTTSPTSSLPVSRK